MAGLPSPSQVADAQPADGSEGSAMSLGQAAASTAVTESVGNSIKGGSMAPGSSQSESQPDVNALSEPIRDDLEQDPKHELKTGQHGDVAGKADQQQQSMDEEAQRAQRKAFAETTLRAFTAKLAGHERRKTEETDEPISVEKHVDQLIKQATSLTTLCQMYEGWTAWI